MAHVRIIGPLTVAFVISLSGCFLDGDESADTHTTYQDARLGIEASIPAGWHVIEKPITAVTSPRQVLAAASYPVRLEEGPPSCTPRAALDQMPPEGVLLQVFGYQAGDRKLARLPGPRQLTYADGETAHFECSGPSLRFVFRDEGRAFQAHIWFNPRAVDPQIRAQAMEIVNGFRAVQRANAESAKVKPPNRGSAVVRCDTAIGGQGPADWRAKSIHAGRVGFFAADFRTATGPRRGRWKFVVKAPLIVESSKPVTLAIAPADRGRAALAFSTGASFRGYAKIRFIPCRYHGRTAWPGGFFLADRQPVRVQIRQADGSRSDLVVGRP